MLSIAANLRKPNHLSGLSAIRLSDLLIDHGVAVIAVGLVGLFSSYWWSRSPRGRERIESWTLSLPVIGPLVQKQALSRMVLVVSSLLRSGVELVDALEIAERSTTHGLLARALAQMQSELRAGRDLRESTTEHKIFTHSLSQVFSLGQQSGQLDKMLLRLGKDYDRQAGLMANRLTTVIEPILILILSIIVGFILFATVLPILEAGNVLAE